MTVAPLPCPASGRIWSTFLSVHHWFSLDCKSRFTTLFTFLGKEEENYGFLLVLFPTHVSVAQTRPQYFLPPPPQEGTHAFLAFSWPDSGMFLEFIYQKSLILRVSVGSSFRVWKVLWYHKNLFALFSSTEARRLDYTKDSLLTDNSASSDILNSERRWVVWPVPHTHMDSCGKFWIISIKQWISNFWVPWVHPGCPLRIPDLGSFPPELMIP